MDLSHIIFLYSPYYLWIESFVEREICCANMQPYTILGQEDFTFDVQGSYLRIYKN